MQDDFNPSPDDHMDAPIASLVCGAAGSWARLLRLNELVAEGSEGAAWVAERELRLVRARDIALRLRAHEAASFIEREYGRETIPPDLMDHGVRYCHAARLLAALNGRIR